MKGGLGAAIRSTIDKLPARAVPTTELLADLVEVLDRRNPTTSESLTALAGVIGILGAMEIEYEPLADRADAAAAFTDEVADTIEAGILSWSLMLDTLDKKATRQ